MVNKYSVGGVIFGIFLLAIMGIRSASNWLTQNDTKPNTQDSVLSINEGSSERRSQSNRVANQTDSTGTENSASQTISPLEEAGTYIQRQKRVEQDPIVANTPVDVISNTVAAQPNTAVNPQPPATTSTGTATSTPSSPRPTAAQPTTPAPSSPAVPALW